MPKKSADPCAALGDTLSPVAHPSPLSIMKWTGGFGASTEPSKLTVRAHDTWWPSRTSDAAWRTFPGVRKLSAPSSSSAPQRPQLLSESK